MLTVKGLSKSYGASLVIKNMAFEIGKGEVVAVIGPSGSGKSTFLKTINQLVKAESGEMTFLDKRFDMAHVGKSEATLLRRQTGMVFQNFGLFSHLNALENITLGLEKIHGYSREEARKRALALLDQVGLSEKASAYPSELSGGQQQRVGIARALAANPSLLLFDEPTSALDPERVGEVLRVIRALASADNTMIIVTHEMAFAREIADRIVFMDEGEVVFEGSPELVFSDDAPLRVRQFLTSGIQ